MQKPFRMSLTALAVAAIIQPVAALAAIPAAHVYHNHMPNFWPFYAVDVGAKYNATAVGAPIRYTYDGQVINLKLNPPAGYNYYLPTSAGGGIMPHDDLVAYYSHNAKTGAYMSWPMQVANELQTFSGRKGQVHVTMSAAVVNNVQDLNTLQNVPGYTNPTWGAAWKSAFDGLTTTGGNKTLDLIHFTGHHSMGPLVGPDYFLKDLIYHNVTLAQSYFLGSSFKSSKGFFPTELGFSPRLVPTLAKLGIQWSVLGNNHLSRTLKDYPFDTYYPTKDTLVSPPNRADLRNTSTTGAWVVEGMAHEQQQIVNKFPFASTPHWVRYVDAATGAVSKVAGIPVDQNGSWEEGWDGSTTVARLQPYEALEPRQFSVVAHDGDNSSGRAGSLDTWQNGYNVTCSNGGYCLGIDEYLAAKPIPATDIAHVQDGSWVDTRDSSSDPQWHHWKLPFCIWKGQFPAMNLANGTNLEPKRNLDGLQEGMTVSFEYGFHYLERNFALLQAAMNYAKTAEQIWLQDNPTYWSPTTAMDNQVTHPGNQLNPWMMSFPVKGNPSANYAGGANPAELAWYFLLPAMDSGFGYYDENKDDHVKGTLAFNNSLYFSKPYVTTNIAKDKTGPSVWWPQRWPYNPGSVNGDKSQGWTVHHYNNVFSVYTYAFDVSGITNIVVKMRPHTKKTIDESDDTYKVYDPAAMTSKPGLSITPSNVGAWKSFAMRKRDLRPVMNGVAWNKINMDTMAVLPAQETGDLYYSYISDYRDQIVDYYIEATDSKGNVTRSEIQQVYVGAGKYTKTATGYKEDINGTIEGTYPFLVIDTEAPAVPGTPTAPSKTDASVTLNWPAATDNVAVTGYEIYRNGTKVGTSPTTSYVATGLSPLTTYSFTVLAYDAANNKSAQSAAVSVTTRAPDTQVPTAPGQPAASAITSSGVTLTWPAATDNYGVDHYDIFNGTTKVGTSTTLTATLTDLTPSTAYTLTIKAVDAAGNTSVASPAVTFTTASGNLVTVYYKPNVAWTTVNIHYQPVGGTWTTTPGVAMDAACTGWKKKVVNLGSATGIVAVFNNGSGTWDNNGGQNYSMGTGDVKVENGVKGTGNPCATVDGTAPSVPTGLTAGTTTTTSVPLSWTASTDNVGVTSYDILRNDVVVGTSASTSYTDTGLTAGTSYTYKVVARDAANNASAASAGVTATTQPTIVDTQKPTAPTSGSYSNLTSTGFTITWSGATDNVGVTGYDVKLTAGTSTVVRSVTTNRLVATGLTPATTYSIQVRAKDAAGNLSSYSATARLKTRAASTDTTAPTAPTSGSASAITSTGFTFSWSGATDNVGVTGYDVKVGTTVTRVTGTSYTATGLAPSTTYPVQVRAVDAAGNLSAYTTVQNITTAAAPVTDALVTFTITTTTATGEAVYVVGNRPELSNWSPTGGVVCTASGTTWTCPVHLPLGTAIEYKYIKRVGSNAPTWMSGSNIIWTTPAAAGPVTKTDTWR